MSNLTFIRKIGHANTDSQDLRLKKSFLTYLAVFMSLGGILWGSICVYYDLLLQSMIPYGYVVISIFNMIFFSASKNIKPVRAIQVFISLALPFLFQWSLGGFYSSGFIMLWAVLSLIASLSFSKSKNAVIWLALFLVLTIASYYLDPWFVSNKPDILADQSLAFTTINICMIITIVFFLVAFFVNQQQLAQTELMAKQDEIELINVSLTKANNSAEKKNKELERMKRELLEITDRQTKINKKLMEEKGGA